MSQSLALAPFGWPVVFYLTLAGLAAGAALLSARGLLRGGAHWRHLGSWGLLLSAAALVLGTLFLIADLEAPARFWLILTQFNPASMISWGVRIVTLFALLAAYVGWVVGRVPEDTELTPGIKLCAVLVVILALAVGLYPAWVLLQAMARPLWGSPWIAPLFFTSALHTGLAALCLGVVARRRDLEVLPGRRFETILVVAQVVLLALYFFTALAGYEAAAARMTHGDLALWLWVGVIAIGWLVPLADLAAAGTSRSRLVVRSCCVLVGGFALRALIVFGGQGSAALLG